MKNFMDKLELLSMAPREKVDLRFQKNLKIASFQSNFVVDLPEGCEWSR